MEPFADPCYIEPGMSGSVSPRYASANILGRAGVVFGHDMTSEAALTKLAYLLALPDLSVEDVARRMSVSIRGELSEQSRTLFQHPKESLSPQLASLTALGYAIAKGDLDAVREVMRGEPEWLLNEADYTGNTPLVSSASLRITMRRNNIPHFSPVTILSLTAHGA
jgi:lysophospholipase